MTTPAKPSRDPLAVAAIAGLLRFLNEREIITGQLDGEIRTLHLSFDPAECNAQISAWVDADSRIHIVGRWNILEDA